MKKIAMLLFVGCLFLSFANTAVMAGQVDILINKLVEKGMLSRSEAEELLTEMQKEGEREKQEIKQVAAEAAKEEAKAKGVDLPKWVENTTFKGDIRLRYQGQERDNSDGTKGTHRSRGRFRLRAGIESEINPKWKAGFGEGHA